MYSEKPLISILVVSYNNTQYLPEVLNSIYTQDYPNIEVLIGDDASTTFDKKQLIKWIDKQKNKRPTRIIINDTNKGTVNNLSSLHKIARGEYLFNIAADDVLFDNTVISKFFDAAEKGNGLWFVAETQLWDQTLSEQIGSFITPKDQEFIVNSSAEILFAECCHRVFLPASYFYKKELLDEIGDLSKYRLVEDWPAQIRLLRKRIKPVFVNSIISSIKHRDGGISHGNKRGQTRGIILYRNDIVNIFSCEVIPLLDTIPEEQASMIMKQYKYEKLGLITACNEYFSDNKITDKNDFLYPLFQEYNRKRIKNIILGIGIKLAKSVKKLFKLFQQFLTLKVPLLFCILSFSCCQVIPIAYNSYIKYWLTVFGNLFIVIAVLSFLVYCMLKAFYIMFSLLIGHGKK